MVDLLFRDTLPSASSSVLDPGCGDGAFIDGIIRWCKRRNCELPRIVGIELDKSRHSQAVGRFHAYPTISITCADFLALRTEPRFDYVVGNPPYVSILELSQAERASFRDRYQTARGRFDLYILFFEQAIRLLNPSGRLVFITPEKYLYVETGAALRRLLSLHDVNRIHFVGEETFGSLTTYPTISVVDKSEPKHHTRVVHRDGRKSHIAFPNNGESLLPTLAEYSQPRTNGVLADVCLRVSCGVATGADQIFVARKAELDPTLEQYAYPTLSGRQLVPGSQSFQERDVMLIPYDAHGDLLPLSRLDGLARYLSERERKACLLQRTCARRKPWHAFHDSVPLPEILRPKILCKDIAEKPEFWIDRGGTIVPRHSLYYMTPKDPAMLDALADYLSSEDALNWMRANCQRAANNFLRLQSSVLRRLPIPDSLLPSDSTGRRSVDEQLTLTLAP